ncbi:hypothetical protein IW138_004902 [Coemansia sp. RSA 986]|nr:hypothetical protein IW138_004902 [Coemansia sp. RSA 986]
MLEPITGKRTGREDGEQQQDAMDFEDNSDSSANKRIKTEITEAKETPVSADAQLFHELGLPIPGQLTQTYTHFSVHKGTDSSEGYVLGVDEAGRGPVLGPMVYAACYCKDSYYQELSSLGFADSKQLSEQQRTRLFKRLQHEPQINDHAGWAVRSISPHDISVSMLRRAKYNLNALAHDATILLLTQVIRVQRIHVTRVFVDTVGPPASYQRKLEQLFPGIQFTVAKKADSLYPIVSAASVCAKVIRDAHLEHWVFAEPGVQKSVSRAFGSGYPGDPSTIKWLKSSVDPVFGYPDIIRFSWSTCVKLLDDLAVPVAWPDDDDEATSAKSGKKASSTKHRSTFANSSGPTIRGLFATATSDANRQRSKFFSRRRPILLNTTL